MTVSVELIVWLVATVAGSLTAIASLRRATFVLHAVELRAESAEVVADSRHLVNDQRLLVIGWLLFLLVGIVGLFLPSNPNPPPLGLPSRFVVWGLVGSVVLWAHKTGADNLYTRRQFTQAQHAQQTQADRLMAIVQDTNDRVRTLEDPGSPATPPPTE